MKFFNFRKNKDLLQDYPRPCEHPVDNRVRIEGFQVLCTKCNKQMKLNEILQNDIRIMNRVINQLGRN